MTSYIRGVGTALHSWSVPHAEGKLDRIFRKIDEDKDGKIDDSELQKAAKQLGGNVDVSAVFKKADSDRDGKITKDELKAALREIKMQQPQQMRQQNVLDQIRRANEMARNETQNDIELEAQGKRVDTYA